MKVKDRFGNEIGVGDDVLIIMNNKLYETTVKSITAKCIRCEYSKVRWRRNHQTGQYSQYNHIRDRVISLDSDMKNKILLNR